MSINTLHKEDDDDNDNVRRDNSRPMYGILSVLFIKRYLLTSYTE